MSKEFESKLAQEESAAAKSEPAAKPPYTTFAALGPLLPEDDDPSVLFRGNWLGHGGGLLITASSGVGKSSLVTQAAFSWSLGKEFLAKPMRKLKCAIIQSEDSRRDLQEIRDGMIKGFTASGWTDDEVSEALDGVHIWNFIGKVGREFCDHLLLHQKNDPVDVIIINPVQGFFGGDISKQEEVSRFLREGLDPILKGEFGVQPCAAVLVQHTPKITSGQGEGRANVNDYGEYIGAGSHEWTDWARAKIVFLRRKTSDIYFDLKAAKRGKRLGWIGKDGAPTTNRLIAHSDGYIFWRIVDDPEEIAQAESAGTNDDKGLLNKPVSERKLKHARNGGVEANAKSVCDQVKASIRIGKKMNNELIRDWAVKNWTRNVGRDAVTAFERSLTAFNLTKDADGSYTLIKPESDCQDETDKAEN